MDVLLECRGLGKRYGGAVALDDVDLQVGAGEIRGLVGHNGAGKSTLLRCALGLVRPTAGRVRVLGREQPPRAGRALDGVAGLVDGMRWPHRMTGRSLLRMLAAYDRAPRSRIDEVAEQLSVGPYLDRRVATLSLGARQRLGVAAALLRMPRLLLLDEPVNGLDPAGRRDLRNVLRGLSASGAAIVVSSHDLAEIAATCHTVTRLDAGRVSWTRTIAEVGHTALRRVGLHTSDDQAVPAALAGIAEIEIDQPTEGGGFVLRGTPEALDEASVALGLAGIAVRRWEPQDPLAAAMAAGAGPAPNESGDRR